MTEDQCLMWVGKIARIADKEGDDESAHNEEDKLYKAFVELVARSGPESLSRLAKIVLSTEEIEFSRWCA